MKENKIKKIFANNYAGSRMVTIFSIVCSAVLILLLAVYFWITANNTQALSSRINTISEHPFAVSKEIGNLRTNTALMRASSERLQAYNTPDDVNSVKDDLANYCIEIEASIEKIDNLYLGPKSDIENLKSTFNKIIEEQESFLYFANQKYNETAQISEYQSKYMYPIYDEFDKNAEIISNYANTSQLNLMNASNTLQKNSLISSVVLFTLVIGILIIFQLILHKINQEIYIRNQQFYTLSKTIEESFFLFEKGNMSCDYVSENSLNILGIPYKKIKENRNVFYDCIKKEERNMIFKTINSTDIKPTWQIVVHFKNPSTREKRMLSVHYYMTSEVKAHHINYVATISDITNDIYSRKALEEALQNAENANSAKSDFLSRMSHEIRTPMNAIIGMTTIAGSCLDDTQKLQDCLSKISQSSKHLLMLINDILDMSKIENNKMVLHEEPFDLFEFVNRFISIVYPQMREKGLDFCEHITGIEEYSMLIGDSLRLNQILMNIISNAIKFTDTGGKITLDIVGYPGKRNHRWLCFKISDTGIGMSREEIERIFQPFEQAGSYISQKYGGTGLGMSITKNLVTLMGGHMRVESTKGNGSSFIVEIPFESETEITKDIYNNSFDGLHVLIADDEKEVCDHTELLLKKIHIQAKCVLNGFEAVEYVVESKNSSNEVDVCFIDWKMPEMDGIETTRQIREKIGPETPIIIISAYDWTEIEIEAKAAGATGFISKPLYLSEIYNILNDVILDVKTLQNSGNSCILSNNTLENMRILMAEDNILNIEIATQLLEMNGAKIFTVKDGKEAVDEFSKSECGYYDAILMDIQMPVMDGYQAAKIIRALDRNDAAGIPIIAVTANAFSEDVSLALEAGMNAHISKPLDIKQLCDTLKCFNVNNKQTTI